jgi:hypothetical protein
MLARSIILVMVSAVYVGRIDTPLLADGVGKIGPVILDSYPVTFKKDILLHEAHRHPYIERLGTMYLMKVRYGDEFAHQAGAIWRLLFVLSLFPWLRKYRFAQYSTAPPDELDISPLAMEEGDGAYRNDDSDMDDDRFDSLKHGPEIQHICEECVENAESAVPPSLLTPLAFQRESIHPPGAASSDSKVSFAANQENKILTRVSFPGTFTPSVTTCRSTRRALSLADMKVQHSATQNREVLLRLENEMLKQQNRRLEEQIQIARRQAVQNQFPASRRSMFATRQLSDR